MTDKPRHFVAFDPAAGPRYSTVNLKDPIIYGLRWSARIRLLSQLFTWAVTLIVLRLLTRADYGLLAMAMAFVGLLYQFAELGLGSLAFNRRGSRELLRLLLRSAARANGSISIVP